MNRRRSLASAMPPWLVGHGMRSMTWSLPGSDYWIDMREPHVFTSARSKEESCWRFSHSIDMSEEWCKNDPEPPMCGKFLNRSNNYQPTDSGLPNLQIQLLCWGHMASGVSLSRQHVAFSENLQHYTLLHWSYWSMCAKIWDVTRCLSESDPLLQHSLYVQPVKCTGFFACFCSGGPKVPWPAHIRPVERGDPSVLGSDLEYLSPGVATCWSCWSCCSDGLQLPKEIEPVDFLNIHRGHSSEHWTGVCPWSVWDPYRLLKFGWHFQPQVHVSHLMDRGRMLVMFENLQMLWAVSRLHLKTAIYIYIYNMYIYI